MAIGEHAPKQAMDTTLKGAIAIGLDEALTAIEESIHGLTDEQIWQRPLPERNSIAAIAMHCLVSINGWACCSQTGGSVFEDPPRFDLGWFDEMNGPAPGEYPDVQYLRELVGKLRRTAFAGLEAATEADLRGPRACTDWWIETGRISADAYMRTIFHAMAHVRQIWLLHGLMGLADPWPRQHWA